MKKRSRGKLEQKQLIVLFSVFIVGAAVLAFSLLSSAGFNPSEYLLARVDGSKKPTLTNVPSSVAAGKIITLKGTGFTPNNNRVHIGKKQVNNIQSFEGGTSLFFEIPAKKDLPNGTYPLFVRNSKGTSNTVSIEITGSPANSFTPAANTPATDNRLTVDLKVVFDGVGSDGPITVPKNTKVTLSWGPTNGTKCTASNGWSGTRSPKGSTSTVYPTTSKTYTLTCSGAGGSASDSVTVNVAAATPTLTFTVNGDPNRATVAYNKPVTLVWKATNVTKCTASGSWSGNKTTSGTVVTPNLTASASYRMRCDTDSGTFITSSLTVNVTAP